MDDSGNVVAEQITPEMLAVYESVKNKIVEDNLTV